VGHIESMGKMINPYNILVGKPERKRPLGIHRRRWEDNTRMNLREKSEHGNEPSGCINGR